MLKSYFQRIHQVAQTGDAREESYYSCLEDLLKAYAQSTDRTHIHITTLPKKTEAGNPDFRVWDGKQQIVGYIEAKPPKQEDLDAIEESEQLKRYLSTFPNVILTNFFEYRLYRQGKLANKVLAARPMVLHQLGKVPPVEREDDLLKLFEQFFSFVLPRRFTAKTLAIELAKRTRFLREAVIAQELREEADRGSGNILGFYDAFQKHLIGSLTHEDFADLYSQTITYGLFAARSRTEGKFNRRLAFDLIPRTIGILRDLFKFISLGELPTQLEWIVDDISEVLATADVKNILHRFYHEGKGRDPVVHFYETFLAEYDPKERERRGVYFTPEPVVSYIVHSIHKLLKEKFGKRDGLASEGVTLLDPAAGTMTFIAETSRLAVEEFTSKYGEGGETQFIKDHILENYYAFELMMAPYAVGHMKMSFFLEELGYHLEPDERFKLYMTNSLEMKELEQTTMPFASSLADESHLAGEVKKQRPILVILGNPPYSGHSANRGEWILELIKDYKQVDGKPLGERNPKWLQDDYVKFLRFAQWKIEQKGRGLVGMITNHSYLDNPTFRGMRQSLMQSFDEIYVLDLHGNSLKRETCPDGSKDENVFDIRQGVAIAFFVKYGTLPPTPSQWEEEKDSTRIESDPNSLSPWERVGERTKNPPLPQDILQYARQMRHNPTDAEARLWQILRNRRLGGFKFRRQHPFKRFILDFYCHDTNLAIEIDGGQHTEEKQAVYDIKRDEILAEAGIHVLRVWSNEVLKNTEGAVERIWEALCSLTPDPSPQGRGELASSLKQGENLKDNKNPLPLGEGTGEGTKTCIYHADLWGLREKKYDWLLNHDVGITYWKELQPKSEFYLFVPRDEAGLNLYKRFFSLKDMFTLHGVGMTTARDQFVIDFDKNQLINRIRLFKHSKGTDEELHQFFNINKKKGWSIRKAWNMLQTIEDSTLSKFVVPVTYRPFDVRWLFYHDSVVWRTVKRVMLHMLTEKENKALCIGRAGQVVGSEVWNVVYCSVYPEDFNLFYRGGSANFPLYVYSQTHRQDLLSSLEANEDMKHNFSPEFVLTLKTLYEKEALPEELFHYIYAVLYADTYREKYAEFLKIDFPRVPFTKEYSLFREFATFGKRLVGLHLLKSPELDPPIARFQGQGDFRVAKNAKAGRRYEPVKERVYINKDQYFEGIDQIIWEYQIGGYQILDKWLKDRKERVLSLDDIKHYCHIATALKKTIEVQEQIEARYEEIEKTLIS